MKKLEEILTKEYLLDCLRRGLSQHDIAKEVFERHKKRISRSSVFYWLRKRGLVGDDRNKVIYPSFAYKEVFANSNILQDVVNEVKLLQKENLENVKIKNNVLHVLISDTHAGFLYDRLGANNYKDVLTKRFDKLYNEIRKKIINYSINPTKIVVNLLGDLVDGVNIYPAQKEYTNNIVLDQVEFMTQILTKFIISLYEYTEEIDVVCVMGNHGRLKDLERANWDTFIYYSLKNIFDLLYQRDEMKIMVYYNDQFFLIYNEYETGHRILLHHGHKIKKNALSHIRNFISEINLREEFNKDDFDIMLYGHVHQARYFSSMNKHYISNGTMYDTKHFTYDIAYPNTLTSVLFVSTKQNPVESIFLIPLEDKEFYQNDDMLVIN